MRESFLSWVMVPEVSQWLFLIKALALMAPLVWRRDMEQYIQERAGRILFRRTLPLLE